jgi:hypothetical protein
MKHLVTSKQRGVCQRRDEVPPVALPVDIRYRLRIPPTVLARPLQQRDSRKGWQMITPRTGGK